MEKKIFYSCKGFIFEGTVVEELNDLMIVELEESHARKYRSIAYKCVVSEKKKYEALIDLGNERTKWGVVYQMLDLFLDAFFYKGRLRVVERYLSGGINSYWIDKKKELVFYKGKLQKKKKN